MISQPVICISREFGSGGRLVGKGLAARLGIPCYDRTIIQKTAERSGLSPDFIAQAEERARNRFFLNTAPLGIGPTTFASHGVPISHQAFFVQSEVIRDLAAEGPCVIVGRCSDYVLGEHPNCLKVFIHAQLEDRVRRCVAQYDLPAEGAETRVKQIDRGRSNYYNYYTGHTWGDIQLYDLCINTSATGIDGAAELIVCLIQACRAKEDTP